MTGRPADVDTGFWLWLAALPLLMAGQVAEAFTAPGPIDRTTVVAITALLATILAAIVFTLLLLLRQGYRWARTILTGGGVATIVYTAVSLFGVARPPVIAVVYAVTGIVGSVLIGGGVYALHRPDATQHFTR